MRLRLVRTIIASVTSIALLTSMSCGPKAGPVKVKVNDTKTPPFQAIILGTDANGGSTIIPLNKSESTVTVDAMWVRMGPPVTGGSTPVKLKTTSNDDGEVRIGMFEDNPGGIGPQMRAGVWISAFLATSTLNKDLTDFKFTADVGGTVDGASASGLMTAGLIAALTGTPLLAESTMTGIINPDGTIGPVGGIPHKFLGSIEKGKKRLGYPIGMRYTEDYNTMEMVDLVKLAKDNGAEAVEIADVYAAYELMTGIKLPRPVPVEESEMALEDEVTAAFDNVYDGWQADVAAQWAQILDLYNMGRLPQGLIDIANVAGAEMEKAEKLKKQGMSSSAYRHMVDAWIYAVSATTTLEVLELVIAGDLIGAKAKMNEYEGMADQTEPMLRKIGEQRPDTMGGHLQMLSAFEKGITGLTAYMSTASSMAYTEYYLDSLSYGDPALLGDWSVQESTVQVIAPAVLVIARAVANSLYASESMEIEKVKTLDYMCSLPNVHRLSTSFLSAAAANVTYFESFKDITDDNSRNYLAYQEPDYMTAYVASQLGDRSGAPETLKAEWGEDSLAWGLMMLASAQLSYFKSSTLISKGYSLGVQNDYYTGRPVAVTNEKAFMNMLSTADRKARENARSAKVATGAIPVQARIAYQDAKLLREGDLTDKLMALELYWKSSAYSQTAVMLARN